AFVDPAVLSALLTGELGTRDSDEVAPPSTLLRPRTPVAVWLPSNVNLLRPLFLALLATVGAEAHFKVGSRGADLGASFIAWAAPRADRRLGAWLRERAHVHQFARTDPQNAVLARDAALRVVFGSDQAVQAVSALPHAPSSVLLGFGDHVSQAWIDHTLA